MTQNLKVVIGTLNSKYIHSSLAPWCLLAGIATYCDEEISAEVVEGTINEKLENAAERILAGRPQVIGLSCYIWNISKTKDLITLIKNKLPNSIVVLGGPEVSYNAYSILEQTSAVDYVISGEGELPFALLLNAISHDDLSQNIPGLCFRKDGQIVVAEPYVSTEEPPSPYTQKYFDSLNGRISYLETSRGCPYSCAFCLSGRCGNARFFDIQRAKKDLLLLANSGTQTVKLVDRTFNANRNRANEIFEFIINNYGSLIPHGVCFHFEIAGDILDEETINILKSAPIGAMQLEIGLQSFNPKTLEAINRKTNIEHLKENIKRVVENANMHIHIDLIAGLPFEDWDSFAKSFNIAYGLKPDMLQLGFLKLLYGAPMRERPSDFPCEYSKEPPYEVLETPWLSSEETKKLHCVEDALERIYNSGRFRRTLNYLMGKCGYTPFELFLKFGLLASEHGTQKISLNDYTALVFKYFSTHKNIDKLKLRDVMVCDYLSTNASGLLPPILEIKDSEHKTVKMLLKNDFTTRQQKGVKRGLALLYSEDCAVYVDYQNKNPVTGEYQLNKLYYKSKI
ncbi:MAG: DUF4080 domain-containing protein [Oscillospiraceae bacterium]|nr:DUF4080 domain-containing protein [Oscillospiraceae bacterium]